MAQEAGHLSDGRDIAMTDDILQWRKPVCKHPTTDKTLQHFGLQPLSRHYNEEMEQEASGFSPYLDTILKRWSRRPRLLSWTGSQGTYLDIIMKRVDRRPWPLSRHYNEGME